VEAKLFELAAFGGAMKEEAEGHLNWVDGLLDRVRG